MKSYDYARYRAQREVFKDDRNMGIYAAIQLIGWGAAALWVLSWLF